MTKETIIAVDAMGGDGGPKIIMPSLREFILENKDIKIKVFGDFDSFSKVHSILRSLHALLKASEKTEDLISPSLEKIFNLIK